MKINYLLIYIRTFIAFGIFLFGMFLVRIYLYQNFGNNIGVSFKELFDAYFLGFRLDLAVAAYIFAPILLYGIIDLFLQKLNKSIFFEKVVFFYLYGMFLLASIMEITDIAYFSYFNEHVTMFIFGIINDDTKALLEIAWKNYHPIVFLLIFLLYATILFKILQKIFSLSLRIPQFSTKTTIILFVVAIILDFITARGSFGPFPITKNIADISEDRIINQLPKNGVLSCIDAIKDYKRAKKHKRNIYKEFGYEHNIVQAFKDFTHQKNIDKEHLIDSLVHHVKKNIFVEQKKPNVVVVMVESFGMPILKYQSKDFNIMGHLYSHFQSDTVFKNFISTANGTIVSLEPFLLNITARPHATPLSQSTMQYISFIQAAAKVYRKSGYETTFIYGGDLSWRNVGNFFSRQGFEHTYGKAAIAKELNIDLENSSHDWGIFDEFGYKFILKKLKNATKPQMIFFLTTNNHPPFEVPSWYKVPSLKISKKLQQHLKGNLSLIQKRFIDYSYALDSLGVFLNHVKNSSLKDNTVIAVTADNNTIEGKMKYNNYYDESKKIPFYLYMPLYVKKEFNTTIPGSHKDIFPTLYHLTLSDIDYIAIGTDLANEQILHCGFNDAKIIMSSDGGFDLKHPKTQSQKECAKYYKAAVVVGEYIIDSQKKKK